MSVACDVSEIRNAIQGTVVFLTMWFFMCWIVWMCFRHQGKG